MYVSMFLDGPLEEIDMMVGTERWSEYMDAVILAYLFIVIADLSSVSLAFLRKLFSYNCLDEYFDDTQRASKWILCAIKILKILFLVVSSGS